MEIKKKMIDKYELEIKRQNTIIEKKQSEIDGLNKKFDELKNVNDVCVYNIIIKYLPIKL